MSTKEHEVSEEKQPPGEAEDDIVVVHHLIRRLGRRPTAAEVQQFQDEQARHPGVAPSDLPVPGEQPGPDHP